MGVMGFDYVGEIIRDCRRDNDGECEEKQWVLRGFIAKKQRGLYVNVCAFSQRAILTVIAWRQLVMTVGFLIFLLFNYQCLTH